MLLFNTIERLSVNVCVCVRVWKKYIFSFLSITLAANCCCCCCCCGRCYVLLKCVCLFVYVCVCVVQNIHKREHARRTHLLYIYRLFALARDSRSTSNLIESRLLDAVLVYCYTYIYTISCSLCVSRALTRSHKAQHNTFNDYFFLCTLCYGSTIQTLNSWHSTVATNVHEYQFQFIFVCIFFMCYDFEWVVFFFGNSTDQRTVRTVISVFGGS